MSKMPRLGSRARDHHGISGVRFVAFASTGTEYHLAPRLARGLRMLAAGTFSVMENASWPRSSTRNSSGKSPSMALTTPSRSIPKAFLIGKGKRKPEVELRWRDLLNGEAAMAVALNASLSKRPQASAKPATEEPADRTSKPAAKKRAP